MHTLTMATEDMSTGPLASEVVPLIGKDADGGVYNEDPAAEIEVDEGAAGAAVANGSAGNDPVGRITEAVEEATPAAEDEPNIAETREFAAVPTVSTTAVIGVVTSVALGKHLFPAAK